MPVDYEIDGNTAIMTASGKVSYKEINGAFENLTRDPDFREGLNILVYDIHSDYNPGTFDMVNAAEHMDSLMKSFSPRIALVVTEGLKYGFGRMLEMYCNIKNIELRVFTELDQAKSWLQKD
jgi:hypothetical protein